MAVQTMPPGVIEEKLIALAGRENVSSAEHELVAYSRDASIADPQMPDYVVQPTSPEVVSKVLKAANEYRIPVIPRANGSNSWGATIPFKGGIVLDTTKMNRILEVNEQDMTVTFEPGITNWQLSFTLERSNKQIGVMPISTGAATIIGNAASTGTSPVCSGKYGTQADQTLGLEVVLPTGEYLRTGTSANKHCGLGSYWRHAYGPDITGLFLGAEGSLGVITKLTLAIYEIPEARDFVEFGFYDSFQALAKAAYEIHSVHHLLLGMIGHHINGNRAFVRAAHELGKQVLRGDPDPEHVYTLMCAFEGTKVEVAERKAKAEAIVKKHGGIKMTDQGTAKVFWQNRFSGLPLHFWRSGRLAQGCVCTPLRMPKMVEVATELHKKHGLREEDFWYGCNAVHPQGVMMRFLYAFDEKDPKDVAQVREFSKELQQRLNLAGGPTYRMGTGYYPQVKDTLPEYFHFLRRIKKALDPNNIMHPGVIGLGLDDEEYEL